jgi:hypothetical protein
MNTAEATVRPGIDAGQQVFLGIALAQPARQNRAGDVENPITAIDSAPSAEVVVMPIAGQHAARVDRPAELGHEGGEMRGDEGQLIAAGKKPRKISV